jgi:GAF domain-containing protein
LGLPAFTVRIAAGDEPRIGDSVGLPALGDDGRRSLLHGLCIGIVNEEPLILAATAEGSRARELGLVRAAGIESVLCFPLRADGWRVIGLLCVVSAEPRDWGEVEVSLITDLSQLAAIEARRDAGLTGVADDDLLLRARRTIVSGLLDEEPGDRVKGLLGSLCRNLGWDAACAWVSSGVGAGSLGCASVWSAGTVDMPSFALLYDSPENGVDDAMLSQVWTRQEPVWAPDLTKAGRYRRAAAAAGAGFREGLWFPVVNGGQALGVIELLAADRHPDHERLSLIAPFLGRQIGGLFEINSR